MIDYPNSLFWLTCLCVFIIASLLIWAFLALLGSYSAMKYFAIIDCIGFVIFYIWYKRFDE